MRSAPEALTPDEAARAGDVARAVLDEVAHVIVGQRDVVAQMLLALLAGGHALLEGVPGTAKTLAIVALARSLDAAFRRVQFTPDLMPADLTGVTVLDETQRRFTFRPGPIFADVVLADEINRAPAKTQAALLEAMQERQVTVDGVTHALPPAFTVFASQNPIDSEGTYPLPEAQLDRFLLKIAVGYPDAADEVGILDRYAGGFDATEPTTFDVRPVLGLDDLAALRAAVRRVTVTPSLRAYIVELVRRTRHEPSLALGASPRAAVALFRAAQAQAVLGGRDYVVPDDVKGVALAVLRHRVVLTADAEVEGATADERVAAVVGAVEAPR
ncbi:MAG TPA: MoxR family ATPase [Candidatus Binatia bacterium]|jgi:MoxR-like ATPase|nr:MoxR family ATPase [Candidatus Binatia bacterium]